MSVSVIASYCNGDYGMIGMYDTAIAIQEDRRRLADIHRVALNLPKEHSLSLGRYRLTLTRQSGVGLPAA